MDESTVSIIRQGVTQDPKSHERCALDGQCGDVMSYV